MPYPSTARWPPYPCWALHKIVQASAIRTAQLMKTEWSISFVGMNSAMANDFRVVFRSAKQPTSIDRFSPMHPGTLIRNCYHELFVDLRLIDVQSPMLPTRLLEFRDNFQKLDFIRRQMDTNVRYLSGRVFGAERDWQGNLVESERCMNLVCVNKDAAGHVFVHAIWIHLDWNAELVALR